MHLVKEEQTLFPYIARMEEAVTRGEQFPRPPFGTVQNPVRMMVLEHDNAGAALHEMRTLSENYQIPPEGCNSLKRYTRVWHPSRATCTSTFTSRTMSCFRAQSRWKMRPIPKRTAPQISGSRRVY